MKTGENSSKTVMANVLGSTSNNVESSQSKSKECDERKSKVLQPSKQKQLMLSVSNGNIEVSSSRGKKRKGDENTAPVKQRRIDGIYEDPKPLRKKQKSQTSVAVQTDKEETISPSEKSSKSDDSSIENQAEKVLNMLTSDTAPPEYWEEMAEKRREALEDTLIENKKLSEENVSLKKEVSDLKEENKLLDEMLQEAKELAQLVESITGEAEGDSK